MPEYSIVEYFGRGSGHECGYCRAAPEGRVSHGLWAHRMSPSTYQDLLDRGWRRSGQYCYKPIMHETCCPQYTIRCEATQNKPTKSQKRVLVAFRNYIEKDIVPKSRSKHSPVSGIESDKKPPSVRKKCAVKELAPSAGGSKDKPVKSLNPSKKRFQRYQRKVERLRSRNFTEEQIQQRFSERLNYKLSKCPEKTIEDFLTISSYQNAKHDFEFRLVQSSPESDEFKRTKAEEHRVYAKYQMAVHNDEEDECTMKQFDRFLCRSPLTRVPLAPGCSTHQGSYHLQYWLDARLIAVAVIDVMATGLSSVYLFYDPDYSFLCLGKVSALQEIAFTRKLQREHPPFKYYYMGYYIHDCAKMKYKGSYRGSSLLCPEAYTWHPLEEVQGVLDRQKYARFSAASVRPARVPLSALLVLFNKTAMPFNVYAGLEPEQSREETQALDEYCQLIGPAALPRMLLFRSPSSE